MFSSKSESYHGLDSIPDFLDYDLTKMKIDLRKTNAKEHTSMQGSQGGYLLGWWHCYQWQGHRIGIHSLWNNSIRATHCSSKLQESMFNTPQKNERGIRGMRHGACYRDAPKPRECSTSSGGLSMGVCIQDKVRHKDRTGSYSSSNKLRVSSIT